MRTNHIVILALASLLMGIGCSRDTKELNNQSQTAVAGKQPVTSTTTCNSNAYVVTLESKTLSAGNWEWVWSVRNPNPGNGTNGTSQDMSHWGMQFGSCFTWADITGAGYSIDGTNWTSFSPTYQVDPSQSCVTTPVLKYNVGTSGTAKTYYKLVISKNYTVDPNAFAYYKSGARMPCCTFTFSGVGCPEVNNWCPKSQGYWFARPQTVWCSDVTFGSNSYTQSQGNNIWDNAPNNSVAKKAFTQASALQLSMLCENNNNPIPADILAAYNTCVNFLAGLTYNNILTGSYPPNNYTFVNAAQGAIGSWISANEATCTGGPIFTRANQ